MVQDLEGSSKKSRQSLSLLTKDQEEGEYQLLWRLDVFSILSESVQQIQQAEVNRAYKRKAQKVQLVDLGELDRSKPRGVSDQVVKSKEEDITSYKEKYPKQLIPKFSDIKRRTRLIKKQIEKLIVSSNLIPQEYNIFVEILYNREKAIAFE